MNPTDRNIGLSIPEYNENQIDPKEIEAFIRDLPTGHEVIEFNGNYRLHAGRLYLEAIKCDLSTNRKTSIHNKLNKNADKIAIVTPGTDSKQKSVSVDENFNNELLKLGVGDQSKGILYVDENGVPTGEGHEDVKLNSHEESDHDSSKSFRNIVDKYKMSDSYKLFEGFILLSGSKFDKIKIWKESNNVDSKLIKNLAFEHGHHNDKIQEMFLSPEKLNEMVFKAKEKIKDEREEVQKEIKAQEERNTTTHNKKVREKAKEEKLEHISEEVKKSEILKSENKEELNDKLAAIANEKDAKIDEEAAVVDENDIKEGDADRTSGENAQLIRKGKSSQIKTSIDSKISL